MLAWNNLAQEGQTRDVSRVDEVLAALALRSSRFCWARVLGFHSLPLFGCLTALVDEFAQGCAVFNTTIFNTTVQGLPGTQ